MKKDLWHYPRIKLAEQVLGMFESGLSNALVFFAPRRMGKTEFLLKDVLPLAKGKGWNVLYFSFLDAGQKPAEKFTLELTEFLNKIEGIKNKAQKALAKIKKIGGSALGVGGEVEFNESIPNPQGVKSLIGRLAKYNTNLILMDEIQVLAKYPANNDFIAALRTALDVHKTQVKVIFTGSSREGLRQMFSKANAPFFHFGQNLPFPEFGREFTDHFSEVFNTVTNRQLNKDELWATFQKMDKIPQLARSLVERLALHPSLTIGAGTEQLLTDVFGDRTFAEIWANCSRSEQMLLLLVAKDKSALYSKETRQFFAKKLSVKEITVTGIQSAIRSLLKKGLIGQEPDRGRYFIDDPSFKNWLIQEQENVI